MHHQVDCADAIKHTTVAKTACQRLCNLRALLTRGYENVELKPGKHHNHRVWQRIAASVVLRTCPAVSTIIVVQPDRTSRGVSARITGRAAKFYVYRSTQ